MFTIKINPLARKDLLDIKKYITEELENPAAATKTLESIVASISNLKDFPLMGPVLSSRINIATDYRYLISGKYIVFYKVESEFISVFRILYSRRDYIRILFDKE
jgi:toxin ParE1/3/4